MPKNNKRIPELPNVIYHPSGPDSDDLMPIHFDEPTTGPISMQEIETSIIKQFLIDISADIQNIDGGCSGCINEFCEGVNETLDKYGLELKYNDNRQIEVHKK